MSIDTTTHMSPGWWLERLFQEMAYRELGHRPLSLVRRYLEGDAPLPENVKHLRNQYRDFQRKSRTNFAEISVEAVQERMNVAGFRIGDKAELSKEADRIWSYNDLDTFSDDVHFDMLGLRTGYAIVMPPEADGIPIVTYEHARNVITIQNPQRPTRPMAGLKLFVDGLKQYQFAYLFLPGAVYVAKRDYQMRHTMAAVGFEWEPGPQYWPAGFEDVVPVVPFINKKGVSEFERHLDSLDRINQTILDRLVITQMQAYKQRGIIGGDQLPDHVTDENGDAVLGDDGEPIPIDIGAELAPGPAALWLLPKDVEMWESGSTDIRPLLEAAKDDIKLFAAATGTPLYMLMPDSQNQSAEGARQAAEQCITKAADRQKRASSGWNQVMALALRFAGLTVNVLDIETLWLPPERFTLTERADAAVKLANILPRKSLYTKILQFSPEEAEEMETEMLGDILASSLAQPVTPNAV